MVTKDGHLELHSALTTVHRRYSPVHAAMWIALRQRDGDLDAAAELLASIWQAKPQAVRAELAAWIEQLSADELVRIWP